MIDEKFATVAGIRLHYVEAGAGPLVLLLHGFPEFWFSWRHQIPALAAAGFRVAALDLRGYNDSDKPRGVDTYRLEEIVRDVAGFLVQTNETPCLVVGHDWGGAAAWRLAMTHPHLVERLVVIDLPHPAALFREIKRSLRQKLKFSYAAFFQLPWIPELLLRALLPWFMAKAGRFTADDIARYRQAWRKPGALTSMLNYYRAVRRERRPPLRPIEQPTLVIWGAKTPVFLPECFERFEEWVPNVRVERIERAGHFVQTDAPERVNELLVSFLRA